MGGPIHQDTVSEMTNVISCEHDTYTHMPAIMSQYSVWLD